jgi:putative transposase
MLRAYKTELDLNNKQRTQFVRYCGVARFVFNWALADRISRHESGLKTSMYEQKKRFNSIKGDHYPWVKEVSYVVEQSAFDNCDIAYKNFFRRAKGQAKKAGFPKFKSKKHGLGSFKLRGIITVEQSRIKLPVLGWVKLKEDGYFPTKDIKILATTISERAGHWFVSLQVEEKDMPITDIHNGVIGVDVGIKTLATCSNSKVFENPKGIYKYEKQLSHIQRELCRRQKGSKNRAKTKQKVAKLHYRISNVRRYALHEVSHYLTAIAKPQTIKVEDLNVAGMMQNRHLSRSIADASFAELRRQLEYKCIWHGIDLVVADRFYPSSKKCSQCGAIKPLLRLSERTYVCESCGAVIDRDLNAAKNLEVYVEPRNGRGLSVEEREPTIRAGCVESPMKQKPSIGSTLENNCRVGIGLP